VEDLFLSLFFLIPFLALVAFIWAIVYLNKLEKLKKGNKEQREEYEQKSKLPTIIVGLIACIVLLIITGGMFLGVIIAVLIIDYIGKKAVEEVNERHR
jgi:ABC-type enterochelin transport system permease subunit